MNKRMVAVLAILVAGLLSISSAAAQQGNNTQPGEMQQLAGDDAIVMYDNAGEYMAIVLNDGGGLEYTSGTVQSVNELADQDLTVCLYKDNVNQDFVDVFQPGQGFFEGEMLGDPLTDQERQQVTANATCYQSQAEDGGGLF